MAPVIEVQNLKKYFPTPRGMLHAVDDVTFTIEKGKTLGVVGESGCGKSTLGRTIIHLQESTAGKIFLEGEPVNNLKGKALRAAREKMQIIFQDPYSSLDPRKTAEQTIREPLQVARKFSKAEIEEKTTELMELVGIDERLRKAYEIHQTQLGGLGGCCGHPRRKDLWPVGGRRAGQQRGHPGGGLGAGAGHRRAGGPGQPGHQPGRPAGAARRRRRRHPRQRGGTGELKLPASG